MTVGMAWAAYLSFTSLLSPVELSDKQHETVVGGTHTLDLLSPSAFDKQELEYSVCVCVWLLELSFLCLSATV